MYQYGTLQEDADMVKAGRMQLESVVDYQTLFHREEILDVTKHNAYETRADKEFCTRFAAPEHHRLAPTLRYLSQDDVTKGSQGTAVV